MGRGSIVAAANRNAVVLVDLARKVPVKEYPVQNLPFEPRFSEDESTLIVSNWGGRLPRPGERTAKSQNLDILVDERGAPASGTVSLIDLKTGATRHVEVGIHPTAIVVSGQTAYVANAMSDSVSEVDIARGQGDPDDPPAVGLAPAPGRHAQRPGHPGQDALRGRRWRQCRRRGRPRLTPARSAASAMPGTSPWPSRWAMTAARPIVLNTKGNGSVSKTTLGKPGNAHDFQGTVTIVQLTATSSARPPWSLATIAGTPAPGVPT